ncbi:MAG: LON peptidase substrate-binding domain-containing protein [Vulcanimicrobiota bacterium]
MQIRAHPYVAVRNGVFFPGSGTVLTVGRPASMAAVEAAAQSADKLLVLLTQRRPEIDEPSLDDLHEVGVRAVVHRVERLDGTIELVVEGRDRVRLRDLGQQPFPVAQVELLAAQSGASETEEELHEELIEQSGRLFELAGEAGHTAARLASRMTNPGELVSFLASALTLSTDEGMAVLGAERLEDAQRLTLEYLFDRIELLENGGEVPVGRLDWNDDEVDVEVDRSIAVALLRDRLAECQAPEDVAAAVHQEIDKLERFEPESVEYQNVLTGLELFLELPWTKATTDCTDLEAVRQHLDQQVDGLDGVKARLLDRLALPGSKLLCFCGPPGTGKQTLALALAEALGREFDQLDLSGVDCESWLCGTPWNAPGASLGQLYQALRRARTLNPVLVFQADRLDETTARCLLALGERCRDRYLGLPFDLSGVMPVVLTHSVEELPVSLRSKLELIELPGYPRQAKIELALGRLLPEDVLLPEQLIGDLIDGYTNEAGVEQLAGLLHRIAARSKRLKQTPDGALLAQWLGPAAHRLPLAGVGLAQSAIATSQGVSLVPFEALQLPHQDDLLLTGSPALHEVALMARSLLMARGLAQGGFHLHLPEIVASDRAAAGLAVLASVASAASGLELPAEVGLIGCLSLTGQLRAVSTLADRLLAAQRAGLRQLILPAANAKELALLPESVRGGLELRLVETIDDALTAALPQLLPHLNLIRVISPRPRAS